MVKSSLSKPLDSKETELVQSKVFELKEHLKSPPKQLNQKELYAINASLKISQDKLNLITKNQFMQVNKEIINIEKNIPMLNKKTIDDPVKAKQQAYAIAKKLVVILNRNNDVTPSQKLELNKRLEPIKVTLAKSGVNLNEVMNKRIKTNETDLKLNEFKELTMPRVRNIGFDRVEKQVKDLSNEIKQSDHTRDNKRELNKQLKSKENEILSVRQSDTIELTETIKKIDKIQKGINERSQPSYTASLNNLERLTNNRSIQEDCKQLASLVKQAKPLLRSPTNKEFSQQATKQIRTTEQTIQRYSQDRSR